MPYVNGYINVYRSGWFHRMGKPSTFDRHGGDLYATKHEALQNIEPRSHYIDTVPVTWYDPEPVEPNNELSEPIPLRQTRRQGVEA